MIAGIIPASKIAIGIPKKYCCGVCTNVLYPPAAVHSPNGKATAICVAAHTYIPTPKKTIFPNVLYPIFPP